MANRVRGKQIAPMIRGAFIRAAKQMEMEGKSLSELIKDELETKPLDTLRVIASFIPKELLVETDVNIKIEDMSDQAIDAEIKRLSKEIGYALPAPDQEAEIH